jgi:hypothetical protein
MRKTRILPVIAAALLAGAMMAGPAYGHGQSAYEMEGGGLLNLTSGNGLPACGGIVGNCTSTTSVFSFENLPIVGTGVLGGHNVAGVYNCPSDVTIIGTTASFSFTWEFECGKVVGEGPNTIQGEFEGSLRFTNPPSSQFPFDGFFTHDHSGSNQSSKCTGGFAPTSFGSNAGGPTLTGAAFGGECTAVTGAT